MRPPTAPPADEPVVLFQLPRVLSALGPAGLVLMLVPLAVRHPEVGPTGSTRVNACLMAFGALVLVFRLRWPGAVVLLALPSGQLPLAVALYTVAARRGPGPLLYLLTAAVELRLWLPFDVGDLFTLSGVADVVEDPLVFGAVPLALGLTNHARVRAVAVLAERNRLLLAAQRHAEERAAAAERARLAREMHDVVSNRVSLITLHAGAAQVARAGDPAAVGQTLGLIRALGLQALTELRGLLGVLTPADDQVPSLRGLSALVEESRQAGLAVGLTLAGAHAHAQAGADVGERPEPEPEPAVQYAAYRIVQEALTNAHKHAPAAEVAVTVEVGPDGLRLAVVNSPAGDGGSVPELHPALPSGGHGLDGMRTRVADLGGTLDAGPTPDGGFAVRARLPLSA
ncbi:sensor histidine kinase [Streptomyces rubellomurinus]|uniref:sensor histidine kinase n=1 Tax=Streptomyces rubellomurinus (strain ATCC 31215) TaxID=359131 RepID=UPI0006971C00|nr:sensor histidine kinase [Streptomyces rubellomurinus]